MDPAFGWCDVICSRVIALVQHPPKMREIADVQSDRKNSIVDLQSKRLYRHEVLVKRGRHDITSHVYSIDFVGAKICF
jgi:hypothetical protein